MTQKIQCNFTSPESAKKAGIYIRNTFYPIYRMKTQPKKQLEYMASHDVLLLPPADMEMGVIEDAVVHDVMGVSPEVTQGIQNIHHVYAENIQASKADDSDIDAETILEIWTEASTTKLIQEYLEFAGGVRIKVV